MSEAFKRLVSVPAPEPEVQRLTPLTLVEMLDRPFAPKDLILSPWLPTQGLAMIYAPRGLGKTHLAVGVACAVATGSDLLQWTAPTPRKVLLVDGEMPGATLRDRLKDATARVGRLPAGEDVLRVLSADIEPAGVPDLATEAGQAALDAVLDDAALVILDNVSTLCRAGRENDSESWSCFQAWMLRKRSEGRSVLLVHHAGKNGGQRGTSRREDVLDTVVSLRRPSDYQADQGARFEVHFEKARGFMGPDAESFEARLTDTGWTCARLAASKAAEARALREQGMTQRDIASRLGVSAASVNRLLNDGSEAG